MNPGLSWPDLHYMEIEQVQLDVTAIIARGTRLRRQRLITRAIAIALVAGMVPAFLAITGADRLRLGHQLAGPGTAVLRPPPLPGTAQDPTTITYRTSGMAAAAFGARPPANALMPQIPYMSVEGSASAVASNQPDVRLANAIVRQTTTIPRQYGSLLAIAGARGGSGVWFTATAAQLTLFRLSVTGVMRSWPVPTLAGSPLAGGGVGLAVTAAGVAWVSAGMTLVRLVTKTAQVSIWHIPASRPNTAAGGRARSGQRRTQDNVSLAVSPYGQVALALPQSSSVQVLDPRTGAFSQIGLPDAADQPTAVGYARNGTLGIGFQYLGGTHRSAVMLVDRADQERVVGVTQPTAVTPYGASELLVGVTELTVVSSLGAARPLALPSYGADFAGADFGTAMTPPALLPGGRLGIGLSTAVLTFPATAPSPAIAIGQSLLWVPTSQICSPQPACPSGYRLLTTDEDGNMWVVPAAQGRTIELVSLR